MVVVGAGAAGGVLGVLVLVLVLVLVPLLLPSGPRPLLNLSRMDWRKASTCSGVRLVVPPAPGTPATVLGWAMALETAASCAGLGPRYTTTTAWCSAICWGWPPLSMMRVSFAASKPFTTTGTFVDGA